MCLSLATDLGILGFFKYFNFFAESFCTLSNTLGLHVSPVVLYIALPVGISFYTFKTLSYTIDVYRGTQEPTRNFVSYALFVSFFPQLLAGPIQRASTLLPQIQSPRRVGNRDIALGLQLLLVGFLKKVVIADAVASYVENVFTDPSSQSAVVLLMGMYLFAIQIYCDFSGYTDIARGLSRLMGIDVTLNFKQPYFSQNITEFWHRWHITLSTWLRDYIYIPLGGNRKGEIMTWRNLAITMLLGGALAWDRRQFRDLGRFARYFPCRPQNNASGTKG